MNLLKNFGNSLKDNFKADNDQSSTKRRSNTIVDSSSSSSPSRTSPKSALSRTTRTQSLSQISALHSHRNMKISLQIQLAESMFQPSLSLILESKLSPDFSQCLSQQSLAFPFFVQYVDSLSPPKQSLIKAFLQAKCLVSFITPETPENSGNTQQFCDDFSRIFALLQDSSVDADCDITVCDDYETIAGYYQSLDSSGTSPEPPEMEPFCRLIVQLEGLLEERFYSHFLCSKYFRMLEYEVLCDTQSLALPDILYASTPIASGFLEFMDREGLRRFVEFLIMHRNFQQYSGQLADALAIYDRFFNLANKCSSTIVELSDKSYKLVEDSLQGSAFSAACFDQIAAMFTQYFTKTYFPQFLQSELFTDYLKACEESFRTLKNRQAEARKLSHQKSVDSAAAESTESSKDPGDSGLWKREGNGQMNLAFIDNYGRINSLFQRDVSEEVPAGKLSQVIKKLTLNDEEEKKRKEEDAWRIAQSIINDVCSVTSTNQPFH